MPSPACPLMNYVQAVPLSSGTPQRGDCAVSRRRLEGRIRDVAVNPDDAAITAAIISKAKSLRLKVIAEGGEDEAQMSFLRAHHCNEIQGYYFSTSAGL